MAQDFKTTFIPKAPSVPTPQPSAGANAIKVHRSVSISTVIATLVVLVALVTIGGTFVLDKSLQGRIAFMEDQLEKAEKQFEPTLIASLQELDERLKLAGSVVRSHRTIVPFFEVLNATTLKTVQFDSMRFEYTEEGRGVVQIEGLARSYEAIAQQSEKFTEHRLIQDHIFSDFSRENNGRIAFSLLITIASDSILFEHHVRTDGIGILENVTPNNS